MSDSESPVSGFSHIQLLVSDVAASEHWYSLVLGLDRLAADDEGTYVALRHRRSRTVVVLSDQGSVASGVQEVSRLDHIAFAVPDGPGLESWAKQLREQGIDHSGVVDELGKPSLLLTDPDGIHVELVAPPGS
ncbi:MAG: VOC family protein [Acidimicrobiales bacterium]